MSAEIRVYDAMFVDGASTDQQVGSLDSPVKAFTLSLDVLRDIQEVSIAPGDYITVWTYTADQPYFDLIRLQILGGAGYLEVGIKSDAETSTTDPTPLGTCVAWDFLDLSCTAPLYLTSDQVKVHATLTTSHNDNGSGIPSRWGATLTAGRVYKVMVRNPADATDSVRLSKAVVN